MHWSHFLGRPNTNPNPTYLLTSLTLKPGYNPSPNSYPQPKPCHVGLLHSSTHFRHISQIPIHGWNRLTGTPGILCRMFRRLVVFTPSPWQSHEICLHRTRFPSFPPPWGWHQTVRPPTLATWKCSDQTVSSTATASAFDVDPELLLLPTVDRNPSRTPRSVNFFIAN